MARKAVKLSDRLTDGDNPTIVVEFDTGYVPLLDSLQNVSDAWLLLVSLSTHVCRSLLIKPQERATLALQKST